MAREDFEEFVKYKGTRPCDVELSKSIEDKVLGENPGHVIPELSPNYDFRTGMIESNSRPVGMFEPSDKPGIVAKKWIVKD